jgi:hypothetical protein
MNWAWLFTKDLYTNHFLIHWDVSDILCLRATCTALRAKIPVLTRKEKKHVLECAFEYFDERRIVYLTQMLGYYFANLTDIFVITNHMMEKDDPRILCCLMDFVSFDSDMVVNEVLTDNYYEMPNLLTFLLPYFKKSIDTRVQWLVRIAIYIPRYLAWAFENCIISRHHVNDKSFVNTFMWHFRFVNAYIGQFSMLMKLMIERHFDLRPLQKTLFQYDSSMGFFEELTRLLEYCPKSICQSSRINPVFHLTIHDFCDRENKKIKL